MDSLDEGLKCVLRMGKRAELRKLNIYPPDPLPEIAFKYNNAFLQFDSEKKECQLVIPKSFNKRENLNLVDRTKCALCEKKEKEYLCKACCYNCVCFSCEKKINKKCPLCDYEFEKNEIKHHSFILPSIEKQKTIPKHFQKSSYANFYKNLLSGL